MNRILAIRTFQSQGARLFNRLLSRRPLPTKQKMAVRCEMKLDAILAGRALSRDRLDKPCSSECLESMAPKLQRWKVLCPSLGLDSEVEKTILKSHSKNPQRRATMLTLWREKFGEKATYLRLASSFEEAKMTDMIFSLLNWFTENNRPSSAGRRVTVPQLGAFMSHCLLHCNNIVILIIEPIILLSNPIT